MAQFAELITYREVIGEEPTQAILHAILKKYQRREVVLLLATLNCVLGTWENAPKFELDARLSDYLLAPHQQRVQAIRKAKDGKVAFSRLSILYLIKQACLACPEAGTLPNGRGAHSDIGLCVLLANDLLLPFIPSPSDDILKRMANLLPFADYISHEQYPMEIGRNQILFNEIAKIPALVVRGDYVDIGELFNDRMGLDHQAFCELIFGCASKFLNVNLEELERNPETAVLRNSFFDKAEIAGAKVTRFFSKITCAEAEFVEKTRQWRDRPGDDLTLFQAYPLIEIANDARVCLDPGFLIDKAGRSLYWTLFAETEEEHRGKLSSFWGAVFESYVNKILGESYGAGGTFIPEPKFTDGQPSFDACILEGRSLLVFEHKSSVIHADVKYGGDTTKLKAELDLKFIEGEAGGKKGLSQLSNHIARFLGGNDLSGISAGDISKIYPVMVCLESSMATPYLGRYLSDRFKDIFPRRHFNQVVTPVFTLGISDVENLLGHLQTFTFSEILESYHSKNKRMFTSMYSSEVPILKNRKPQRNIVLDQYSEFAERMIRRFFPNEVPPNPGDN